ncbi:MAG: methyl-accepting chemotaxis protein [Gammaproteobacteria bacterium]|nr:methyl-accepting chemotaxis protein [Gammaproteobacteria bacterium]
MNIRNKMLLGSTVLTIVPIMIVSIVLYFVATNTASEAIDDQVHSRLTAMRDAKKAHVEDYFNTMQNQARTFANNKIIIDAMREFRAAFAGTDVSYKMTAEKYAAMEQFYAEQFGNQYESVNKGRSINSKAVLDSIGNTGQLLQHIFLARNDQPLGSKHKFIGPKDNSDYTYTHGQYHPSIRYYLEQFGYYDIFLVDKDTGQVVYSVFKEVDFATSLIDGPFANSGLARAFKAMQNAEAGRFHIEDFSPYTPSYDAQAAFISTPVYDMGEQTGVLIFQLPIDRIRTVMTYDGKWQDAGMGESGETYLVGTDLKARSISRFLIEDKAAYLEALKASGTSAELIKEISIRESNVGLQSIDTSSAKAAISGKSGVADILDYRGVEVLSAYAPLNIPGVNWGILSELDMEEAHRADVALGNTMRMTSAIVAVVIIAIAVALAILFATSMTRPIQRMSNTVNEIAENADLTLRVDIKSKDELGTIATSLNHMLDRFASSLGQVSGATAQLASAAEEMSAITTQTTEGTQRQQVETSNVATAMNEMTATVQEVARNATDASEAANYAEQQTRTGDEVVKRAIGSINKLASEVEGAVVVIHKLESDSHNIGAVVNVITEIAEQTNLLALNAAIEAARAGEQGRGFAVVADEVRTLASRTQQSTEEIRAMVESLQAASKGAADVMNHSKNYASETVQLAQEAGSSLSSIAEAVKRITDMNHLIASSAEEQNAVADEINRNVTVISDIANETADGSNHVASASEQLAHLATELQAQVTQFKL